MHEVRNDACVRVCRTLCRKSISDGFNFWLLFFPPSTSPTFDVNYCGSGDYSAISVLVE